MVVERFPSPLGGGQIATGGEWIGAGATPVALGSYLDAVLGPGTTRAVPPSPGKSDRGSYGPPPSPTQRPSWQRGAPIA